MAEEAFIITGLSPSYAILMLLVIDDGAPSQNQLCKQMNLKASTITRFIDKLVTMKYVERTHHGRTTYISATEKGEELEPTIREALHNLYKKYCELLGEEFAIKLTADIHKANEILSQNI